MSIGSKPKPQVSQQAATSEPWKSQQPYLKDLFANAKTRYHSDSPGYFPDDTFVPFSNESRDALDKHILRAMDGSPINVANSEHANAVLSGDYLNDNQYLDGMYDHAAGAVTRNYNNVRNPSIDSSFENSGRYGSDLWRSMRADSNDDLQRNLTGMASDIYGGNYARERQNMMNMSQIAPGIADHEYADADRLFAAGGALEGKSLEELDSDINRWNFDQNIEDQKLSNYAGLIDGNYGYSNIGNVTSSPSYSSGSGFGQAVGLGLQVAKLAKGMT